MINRKCRVAISNLQKLRLIRKCLTPEAAKIVAHGLVIAHLDYANAIYIGLPQFEINKLQKVQNMAAKVITCAGRYDSSTEALKTLLWLPIHLRIQFKIATLVFRSLHGIAPKYLCDLIKLESNDRYRLRSFEQQNILAVPFTKCGGRFSLAGRA